MRIIIYRIPIKNDFLEIPDNAVLLNAESWRSSYSGMSGQHLWVYEIEGTPNVTKVMKNLEEEIDPKYLEFAKSMQTTVGGLGPETIKA